MPHYRKLPTFVRNDLLKASTLTQMQAFNGRAIEDAFRREHTAAGEHNTPLIARAVGTALLAAGPTYSLQKFNADVTLETGHNPSAGKVILTVPSSRYGANSGTVQVQNAFNFGSSAPCVSAARYFDDTRVEVYSSYWNGNLGDTTGEDGWIASDSAFHAGIHARKLAVGSPLNFGALSQTRRTGLRSSSIANPLIQASADLQVAMDVAHTAGEHDVQEVAKYAGRAQWTGSVFQVTTLGAGAPFDGTDIADVIVSSTGVVQVQFTNSLNSNDYQVFVACEYARTTGAGGSIDDFYVCCAPESERGVDDFYLYFYKQFFDGADEYWDRAHALDFHFWIFDNH
jgi:hypothetical protein